MLQKYWNQFVSETEKENVVCKGSICFGESLSQVQKNCAAILEGKKCLMTYPANGYRAALKGTAVAGDLNIVVDWVGKPVCIIETIEVSHVHFAELDEEQLAAELPENEDRLEFKEAEFKRELEELGAEFNENIPVICESFRVIWSAKA